MSKTWRRNRRTVNLGSSWIPKLVSCDEFSTSEHCSELSSPACSEYEEDINENTEKFTVNKYEKESKQPSLHQDDLKQITSTEEDGYKGDKKKPFYVPRNPSFFQHDLRTTEEEGEVGQENDAGNEKESNCWKHDMYDEEEQQPKSRREIVDAYGYDIRSDNPTSSRSRRGSRKQKDKKDKNSNYVDNCSGSYKDDDHKPCDNHSNLKKNNKICDTPFRDEPSKLETCRKNVIVNSDKSVEESTTNKNFPTYFLSTNQRKKCFSGAFPYVPLKKPPALKKLLLVKTNEDISPEKCKTLDNSETAANFAQMKTRERLSSPFKMSTGCCSKDCEEDSKLQKPLQTQIHYSEMHNIIADELCQSHQQSIKIEDAPVYGRKNYCSSERVHSPLSMSNRQIAKTVDALACKCENLDSADRVHPPLNVATMQQNTCGPYELYSDLMSYPGENSKTFSFPDPPDLSANHLTPWVPQQQYYLQPYYQQGIGSTMSTGCYAYQEYYQGSSVAVMKQQFFRAWPSSFQHKSLSSQVVNPDPFYISQNNGADFHNGKDQEECNSLDNEASSSFAASTPVNRSVHRYSVVRSQHRLSHASKYPNVKTDL